ncbi:MAG TPA: PQQ-binding-like beta-propeller repeat protein, partial [Pirellulaceae bacterium]|nr:PQQ-binding-like beta-propeller repeat protein [Pirellulaceae bacterium]
QAAEWPQFRGPDGQGHSAAKQIPLEWSETKNVAWKTELPGKGWSSPVIAGEQIWMTYAIETPLTEEQKKDKLKGNTGNQPLQLAGSVSMHAVCVDRATGKLLHDVEVLVETNPQWVHALNSFASPTPVIADGKLFCYFGSHGTACLDMATQKVLWTNRELVIVHENGPGSSPVLWKNRLIVHCDGSDVQYIAALDTETGKLAWKTPRSGEMRSDPQLKKAYGTPILVPVNGQEVVVSPASDWLYGYDPETGRELWKVNYGVLGFSIVPRPVAGNGLVYMSTTFMQSELLAVKLDGSSANPEIAWRYKKGVPQMPSPLLVGDELYMVSDKGVGTCLDAKTGELLWSERLGGNFCSSPLFVDGRIYVSNREGATFVIKPGRKFELLATNQLDGQIMASPAVVDGALFIRTEKALYRISTAK